jgi:DNA-binding IclR family transcriptional regulator
VDLWRASSGRVMLAFQPPGELARAFARVPLPPGMTEARVRADLAEIARRGHEIVDSFVVRGIVNISTPIIDHTGLAVAALTVPHLERYGEGISFADCCTKAIAAAARLSRSLGGGVAG